MELYLLAFIIIVQNTAVFLDNHAIFYLTSHYNSSKIATAYTKKFQIDFLSRGFLFFTPPLLGLMLTQDNLYFLLLCLLSSSAVTLILTLFQSFNFLTKMKMTFSFPLSLKNVFLLLIGLIVYAIYLYVPFYLNILSYFFKEHSLWIVQLSPALLQSAQYLWFITWIQKSLNLLIQQKIKKILQYSLSLLQFAY